jgi:hypothetical protein
VPREEEDHGRPSVIRDIFVLQEVGFESVQDGRTCGILILDQKYVLGRDLKPLVVVRVKEVFLECSRVIDGSSERGEARCAILEGTCQLKPRICSRKQPTSFIPMMSAKTALVPSLLDVDASVILPDLFARSVNKDHGERGTTQRTGRERVGRLELVWSRVSHQAEKK